MNNDYELYKEAVDSGNFIEANRLIHESPDVMGEVSIKEAYEVAQKASDTIDYAKKLNQAVALGGLLETLEKAERGLK